MRMGFWGRLQWFTGNGTMATAHALGLQQQHQAAVARHQARAAEFTDGWNQGWTSGQRELIRAILAGELTVTQAAVNVGFMPAPTGSTS